jgi:hypothetical protein
VKPQFELCIEIGEIPILVHTDSAEFASLLQDRYGKFVVGWRAAREPTSEAPGRGGKQAMQSAVENGSGPASAACLVSNFQFPVSAFELDVELLPPGLMSDAEEARVRLEGGRWVMERGDFRAECDPVRRRGWVRQSANPYSIDAVLRMLHSLILARDGGFLVHAASAVRNGRAFLFAGVSGAGKTTISRLAPPDVVLLTDEISYVRGFRIQDSGVRSQNAEVRKQNAEGRRQNEDGKDVALDSTTSGTCLTPDTRHLTPAFVAFGTPFAGELARIGENLRAPIAALYLLSQGPGNIIEDVSQAEAVRALLQNILFFAQDDELARLVFQTAFEFVSCVPVRRLVFAPDARVWDLIR